MKHALHPVIIRLYRQEEVIVAESINCPGLATHADSIQEAVTLMEELIPAWFESASRNHFKIDVDPNRVFFENETNDSLLTTSPPSPTSSSCLLT